MEFIKIRGLLNDWSHPDTNNITNYYVFYNGIIG
jgi:hypothetical protein